MRGRELGLGERRKQRGRKEKRERQKTERSEGEKLSERERDLVAMNVY